MATFTMRLPDKDYEALQAMALLTGRSMAELVRDAVGASLTDFASSAELRKLFEAELRAREQAVAKLKQRLPAEQREDLDDPEAAPASDREPVPAST